MAEPFWPVYGVPGVFEPNTETVETPPGSGLYSTGTLVETPLGSGLYAFTVALPSPPDITPHTDYAPVPRVDVLFDNLPFGAVYVTVFQISAEGTIPVRSAIRSFAAGGYFITDYEVPLGIPVSYRAEQFDAAGNSMGFTDTATTQVDIPVGVAVFQDPLEPAVSAVVGCEASFAETLSRTREVKRHLIGFETIALMGAMSLLEDVNLRVWADADVTQRKFDAVLSRTQVLVRTMPPMPLPRAFHVVIPSPKRVPFDIRFDGETNVWDLTAFEVTRSTLDIIVPPVTWQRVIDAYPTWADVIAAHPTWLDVLKNPPPEA